jgi:hypothetical protein
MLRRKWITLQQIYSTFQLAKIKKTDSKKLRTAKMSVRVIATQKISAFL